VVQADGVPQKHQQLRSDSRPALPQQQVVSVLEARAGGFRDGARANGASASGLSEAVRRLEAQLGVRLLNRTTRSVAPTAAGQRLLERLGPALTEVEAALDW